MDKMDTDLEMESPINNYSRPRPSSTSNKMSSKTSLIISILAGLSLPILIPTGHMVLFNYLWGAGDKEVDRAKCSCSCWDTVFKGPYESGIGRYKHVYFNSTSNAGKMWATTVLFFVAFYEAVKHLVGLLLKKRLRWSMALLLAFSIHSHYYAWWGQWNYWNDEFYSQWWHQLFFTLTELLSSGLVLSQVDKRRATEPLPLILIGTIAAFHVSSATWDQFYQNVLRMEGELHQVLRDVFFMSTDCVPIFVVFRELGMIAERRCVGLWQLVGQRNHLVGAGVTTAAMFLYFILFT